MTVGVRVLIESLLVVVAGGGVDVDMNVAILATGHQFNSTLDK